MNTRMNEELIRHCSTTFSKTQHFNQADMLLLICYLILTISPCRVQKCCGYSFAGNKGNVSYNYQKSCFPSLYWP